MTKVYYCMKEENGGITLTIKFVLIWLESVFFLTKNIVENKCQSEM